MLTNPRRWPFWAVVAVVLLGTASGVAIWLFKPTYVDIDPIPWIGRSASQPVVVFAWPRGRMSIVLIGQGKMRPTEIYGHSWPIDSMENPVIYGVQDLPPEFLGVSTETLLWAWGEGDTSLLDKDYGKGCCPLVLLETTDKEVVAALGADQLVRRKTTLGHERTWAHNPRHDWRECRYEKDMPIGLYECNPVPKMLDPEGLHGATPDDVVCNELEVDSRFGYYLLTTNDYLINMMVQGWVGSGAPHLTDGRGWMIIPNPLIHGDGNGAKVVEPAE